MRPDEQQPRTVAVRTPEGDLVWTLTVSRAGRDWRLSVASAERKWIGTGTDCFKAQRELRRRLDAEGILLGVNGARPNSWSSGVQCDMGEGRTTYLLKLGARGQPPQVPTLDAAPLDAVGTVEDQDEYQRRWFAERGP